MKDDIGNDLFTSVEGMIVTKVHPATLFMHRLISKCKLFSYDLKVLTMDFHDKKCRRYVVDLEKLKNLENFIVFQAENSSPKYLTHLKYFQPRQSVQEVLDDMMILEIAHNSGVNLQKELHLIGLVFDFIEDIKREGLFHG